MERGHYTQHSTALLGNKLSTLAAAVHLLYYGVLYWALLITPVLVTCLPFKNYQLAHQTPTMVACCAGSLMRYLEVIFVQPDLATFLCRMQHYLPTDLCAGFLFGALLPLCLLQFGIDTQVLSELCHQGSADKSCDAKLPDLWLSLNGCQHQGCPCIPYIQTIG